MSGGVVLIDYDRDGWPDIYFTNAPTVDMAVKGEKSLGVLYHNNHDGTFTDVTAKAGLATRCFAMGGAVGDIDNDGWPDLYVTCLGGNILYRNNGNGTFTDTTAKAGVADGRWSTGAAFGDYDGDGFVDLMVTNYVDFHLNDPSRLRQRTLLQVSRHRRAVRSSRTSWRRRCALSQQWETVPSTDVSKAAGVDDPNGYYGPRRPLGRLQ